MQFGIRKDLSYNSNEWRTPPELFDKLNEDFHFNLDAACNRENCLCDHGIYVEEADALTSTWNIPDRDKSESKSLRIFVNPPYGRGNLLPWTTKIVSEYKQPYIDIIVALLPVASDTTWFQDNVLKRAKVITFIKGRVKYLPPKEMNIKPTTPTFGSCLAVYTKENHLPAECIYTLQLFGHSIYNWR